MGVLSPEPWAGARVRPAVPFTAAGPAVDNQDMTVAELLALPVGQRLFFDLSRIGGPVTTRDADDPSIAWDDGRSTVVNSGDDDLVEFTANLHAVEAPQPTSPANPGG